MTGSPTQQPRQQQLTQLQKQLKEMEAAATRISAMSDTQAQSHATALAQLLQRLPPEDDAADAGSRESEGSHAGKLPPSEPSSSSKQRADHAPTAASEQAAAAAVDPADPPGISLSHGGAAGRSVALPLATNDRLGAL